ncbi:MAG: response regulator transcription factor [Stenotrophobium sp.]
MAFTALGDSGASMKILLVDDHELFRAGLRLLLLTIERHALILEASTIGEALAAASAHSDLNLCLLDLGLKNERGLDALQQIKAAAPDVAVVVVSALDEIATVHRCIDAGAMSFVSKSASPQLLTKALRQVLRGNIHLPREVFGNAQNHAATHPALTQRQLEVLREVSLGLPTKSISRKLNIAESTVNEHISAIFQALGAHNRTQAVMTAGRMGLRFDGG